MKSAVSHRVKVGSALMVCLILLYMASSFVIVSALRRGYQRRQQLLAHEEVKPDQLAEFTFSVHEFTDIKVAGENEFDWHGYRYDIVAQTVDGDTVRLRALVDLCESILLSLGTENEESETAAVKLVWLPFVVSLNEMAWNAEPGYNDQRFVPFRPVGYISPYLFLKSPPPKLAG